LAFAIATLLVLVIVDFLREILSRFAAYRGLYEHHAFYVPEGIDKIGGVVLCALAVWVLRRVGWKKRVVRELGLNDSPLPAVVFALAASSSHANWVLADAWTVLLAIGITLYWTRGKATFYISAVPRKSEQFGLTA
jgi:hypothetical protein